MLQINANSFRNEYCPYDLPGTIVPSGEKTKRISFKCLYKDGSSGYLEPDMPLRIPE